MRVVKLQDSMSRSVWTSLPRCFLLASHGQDKVTLHLDASSGHLLSIDYRPLTYISDDACDLELDKLPDIQSLKTEIAFAYPREGSR